MKSDQPPHQPQSWEHLFDKDPHVNTGFRVGVVAAILIHAGIFAVTFPTIAQAPPEEPDQIIIPCVLYDVVPRQPPPPMEFTVPSFPDDATIIVPGPPEEDPFEPMERELPPPPIYDDRTTYGPPFEVPLPPPPPDPPPTIVTVNVEIDPPEVTHRVEPRYTEGARHTKIQGVVILDLVIDTEGRVESIQVLRGLPLGLTRSAVEAVEQWRFKPSTYNDNPVAVRYILTVRFTLA